MARKKCKDSTKDIEYSINVLSVIFLKQKIIVDHILHIMDRNKIDNLITLISSNKSNIHSCEQKKKFVIALNDYKKYLEYIYKYDTFVNEDTEGKRIRAVMMLPRFEYGFKTDSVELFRFRNLYEELHGCPCLLSDDQLLQIIRNLGFVYEGKVYLISNRVKDVLTNELHNYKNDGARIIYYEMLYELHSKEYFAFKIVSVGMLKVLLQDLVPEYVYKTHYFVLSNRHKTELELLENEIVRVWGNHVLRSVENLSCRLPLISIDKVKLTLSRRKIFIWNSLETYSRMDLFNIEDEEIRDLISYINDSCDKNGGISLDELPLGDLHENNSELSKSAFFSAIYNNIEEYFDRNEKILTKKGTNTDLFTAVIEFCKSKDRCTYEQLGQISRKITGDIDTNIIVEAGNAAMIRIDEATFVTDTLVNFTSEMIDRALDKIITSDFIGMREITTFSIFPFCGYAWNLFLLESYCRRFSNKYRYKTRRAGSSNSGAIVSKDCLLNYHEIMAHAVARIEIELNEEEVYTFLTSAGYIERKRYNKIRKLINDVEELRTRRK